jgi:hypothetical protein
MAADNPSSEKLRWHPAFFQAVQLELADYQGVLEFKYEHQLTTEPLRIDILIIKKSKDVAIEKNIARIFRADNILEYKSPEDYLSVEDFLKVYAYANLYAAITPGVDLSGITLTFVENRHPRKLLEYLTSVRGYEVTETLPGIYTVRGDYLPIQIIESKRLSEAENLWLRSLTDDLEIRQAGVILEEGKKQVAGSPLDVFLDVVLRANPEIFLEVQNMAGVATFEEVFTRAGLIPQWLERGREEGREQGREEGREQGLERGREEIARTLLCKGWTAEETAEVTKLPLEKVRLLTR